MTKIAEETIKRKAKDIKDEVPGLFDAILETAKRVGPDFPKKSKEQIAKREKFFKKNWKKMGLV